MCDDATQCVRMEKLGRKRKGDESSVCEPPPKSRDADCVLHSPGASDDDFVCFNATKSKLEPYEQLSQLLDIRDICGNTMYVALNSMPEIQ